MANYRVNIGNRTYDVRIDDEILVVNGDRITYNLDSLNSGGLQILRQPNKNVEAYVEPNRPGLYDIQIDGKHLRAKVMLGIHPSRQKDERHPGNIHAPMPGLIVGIMVKIGDKVKKGQTLLVQEAMKMQMKLKAPAAGIVSAISITPGSRVEKDYLLMSLEPAV